MHDVADFAPSVLEAKEIQCISLICLVCSVGPEGSNLNVFHDGTGNCPSLHTWTFLSLSDRGNSCGL